MASNNTHSGSRRFCRSGMWAWLSWSSLLCELSRGLSQGQSQGHLKVQGAGPAPELTQWLLEGFSSLEAQSSGTSMCAGLAPRPGVPLPQSHCVKSLGGKSPPLLTYPSCVPVIVLYSHHSQHVIVWGPLSRGGKLTRVSTVRGGGHARTCPPQIHSYSIDFLFLTQRS